ncbi:hypothetical protein BCR36DRAFT_406413 [Piromyces finnis]|uniref:Uncharacterized protein n=1 Tax=Piromyces finnis TaxID=1754191 RepID=A0A1Y1V247_9FUNG|nr:hypothetical protein BCR36DRAFT_406413 [Piromyces finnis]|eukprot:ORX44319.1 hypothetical protein BCR36DRAFT_406413 [Piromyces finnis]
MNSADMRVQLYENLKRSGITDKMKSQLRSCIVQELLKNTKLSNGGTNGYANIFENDTSQKNFMTSKVLIKTINSMIIDYLKASSYEFTLSVFLPECGMSKNDEIYNEDDIKKVLNINKNNIRFNDINKKENEENNNKKDENPLLVKVLNNLSKMYEVTYVEREIQTELSPLEQLDQNIGKINMEYDIAMKRQQEINNLKFEDRIIQYQKECEKRIRKEIEDEFERYKDIELGKLKLEEKRKQDLLISENKKRISDLEYEYTQKLREKEIEEKKTFLLKEQEFKQKLTKQQQKFNDEIERFLSKEDTLKREIEMNRKSQKLQEELIQKRLNDALKEIERLKAQDIDSNKIINEAKSRYKQEYEQKFNNKIKEIDMEKKQLLYNQQELNCKLKKISLIESKNKEIKNEYDKLKNKYQNLMIECNYIKNTSNKMAIENRNLQIQLQSNNNTKSFEDEIKSLKNKLIESQNQNEKRQLEYQEIIKTMISQSQKDINKNKKQIQWKQECEELIQKLNNEITHSEELKKICDEKTLKIKELERENADLSLLLHQTQSALQFSNTNKYSLYENEINDQKVIYNDSLNNLKSNQNGSYSNFLTSINKLPDPWMNLTPTNNNNVLLNSSVLPPPFSYIDIDKNLKREIIMRQVQEKEEQKAKIGNINKINNSLNYNNIEADVNNYTNNIDNDKLMNNLDLNLYNNGNGETNEDINNHMYDLETLNSMKPNNKQQPNYSQSIKNQEKKENNKFENINNPSTSEIEHSFNNFNKLSCSQNQNPEKIEPTKQMLNSTSVDDYNILSNSENINSISKNNSKNNLENYDILSNSFNTGNDLSIKNKLMNNSIYSSKNKTDNINNTITQSQSIQNNNNLKIKNNMNYIDNNEIKVDNISIHSKQNEEIGKSISISTLDIDSTELEIDLNQNSMKVDDAKIDNANNDTYEVQYKMLAQDGEDHIKELENRVLQGFESDEEIVSIMNISNKSNLNKSGSIKEMLDINKDEEEKEKDDDDEETEKERPNNKWLKSKPTLNNANDKINKSQSFLSNSNLSNKMNNSKDGIDSLLNVDKDININNLKLFDGNESNENDNNDDNSQQKMTIKDNENNSYRTSFTEEDIIFNWEDEYDKSKIENTFKEINEKNNLDFSRLSLKTSSSTLSKKSLMTKSSIKFFSDNFGEGNTEDDEFSAPMINSNSTDSW